jgi:hypothetical protein
LLMPPFFGKLTESNENPELHNDDPPQFEVRQC